jgi:uncharacterized protein (DUF58 family)
MDPSANMTTQTSSSAPTRRPRAQPTRGARSGTLIDPAVLMRIARLELRAKVVVEGFWNGLHRSPFHGFSVEFTEYRQYSPGDDPRFLDWRLDARSDRLYVKRFEDETNMRCHLLVDQSRSMAYGSLGYSKSEYANTLAATLAYFLARQRDAVGLVTFDERIAEFLPARFRPGHLHRIMLALERPGSGVATDIIAPLRRVTDLVAKRGVMALISDLLAPIDLLETSLASLCSRGHEVVLFQVLDPAEVHFDFPQASLFRDLESGRDLYVDPSAARREYLRRFEEHHATIRSICNKLGIEWHRMTTDTPLELTLFDYLRERLHRGRLQVRANMRPVRGAK